ncbi:MAG: hypothetical protein K5849_06475 [Bacteroidales bacterium]|nr:hypothetical protein [Bacteroidales bacterium]
MTSRRPLFLILLLASLLPVSSCSDQRMQNAFCESEEIRLMVGGDIPFVYDPGTCQMAFSRDLREFRAHTDNMSDFYAVTLSDIPSSIGQRVSGNLIWTTREEVLTRKNLTLEVVRIEGEQFWLWSQTGRIGLTIKILE